MRFVRFAALMGGALLAVAVLVIATANAAEGIETPAHDVLATAPAPSSLEGVGAIELRRYAPMIVAEVTVEAEDRDAASSKGFRPLAGYIFGRNAPESEIAMTAPVTTAPADGNAIPTGEGRRIAMTAPVTTSPGDGEGAYTVRFMMPSQYTMETLPRSLDPNVRLVEVPGRDLVALRFTGERSAERVEEVADAVQAFVNGRGLEPIGPFATAGYDGPDVPTARRRWEVQQPVARR